MKSRKKPSQKRTRSLFLEPLESRVVLAGNVRAFVSGGNLNLDGDSKANEILIEQTANNQFVVSSRDGSTTINGQAGPLTFRGVNKSFDINMGNGNDVVEIAGSAGDVVRVRNRLFINTGSGADQVLLTEVHALGLHINTGSGRDLINVGNDGAANGLQVTKEAIVLTGSGQDDARIANSLFKRFLNLDTGSNNDEATVQGSDFRRRSILNGSSGFDTLNRDNNDGPLRFLNWERTNKTVTAAPPLVINAVDDAATIVEDATPNTVTGNVLTNDVSSTSTKTVTAVNGAAGSVGQTINGQFGTFQINANGTFTYTLNNANATVNALNNGQTLTDSMNYTAGDGSTTDTATLRVTIQGTTELAAVDDTGTITEDASPNTTTGNVLTNDTGGAGTKTVTAVNGAAGSVAQDVVRLHGTFRINADGTFTYTLNNADPDVNALNNGQTLTDTITYTVTAGGSTSTATLTITIQGTDELTAVADAGTVTEDASPNTTTGNVLTNDTGGAGTKTVTAVNGATGSVAQDVVRLHGTFRINADGTFTYTLNNADPDVNALNNGQTLTDTITYTVTAGGSTSTATLTITIQGTDELTAVADAGTVTEDAAPNTTTGDVLANDTGGADTKTVTAVNGATGSVDQDVVRLHGTFHINVDGTFTYTLNNADPDVNALNNGETLTDTITYTVTAGGSTSTATLTITIQGTDELTAVADAGTVTEDASPNTTTGDVLANDTGGAGTKTVTAVNGAAGSVDQDVVRLHGTFHINVDGTFTYTLNNADPDVNALNNGETLTDTITYTVTAGGSTSTATLTITINGHTELVATNDTGSVTEDDPTNTSTGDVLANDTGGGPGAKTVTAVEGGTVGQTIQGQFGTFQINADGTFTYTLDNNDPDLADLNGGETATDEIDYTVSDGIATDIATLMITITGNTDAGAVDATNDTGAVTEDDANNMSTGNVLTNDTGSGTLEVTAVNGSAASVGMSVNGNFGTFLINQDGSFTYTLDNNNTDVNNLNNGETLTDTMTYTAGNGTTSDIATLDITITGATDP